MDEQALVDVEVTHENADDLSDAVAAASASKAAEADATDFPAHRRTVVANRLLAGQPDTELRSLSEVDDDQVKLLEHQVDAAHRALFEMNGKALLADEVGLGKTIEVGMILKEMHYRETDGSVLILTPAQLAKQWQGELASKFGLEFICNYDDEFAGFDAHDRIITSIDTAKSDRHQETVLARDWDVLVMDEAHYVKNQGDRSIRSRRRPHLRLCLLPDGDARPERTRGPL
jgi:SNF2 family DNA or RNA helicase